MCTDTDLQKTVFLMGDSLVQEYTKAQAPLCGWGKFFGDHLLPHIKVVNHSRSGWTTETFLTVGHDGIYPGKSYWQLLIQDIKAGDWLVICLGVNDASLVNEHRTDEEQYRKNLTFFTEEVHKKGANVIFGTLSIRGGDNDSALGWNYTLAPEGTEPDMDQRWVRRSAVLCEIGRELNVEVFQLNKALPEVYENMYREYMTSHPNASVIEGRNYVRYFFHLYNKNINAPVEEGGLGMNMPNRKDDSTHLNARGAKVYADIVAKLISKTNTELAEFIKVND